MIQALSDIQAENAKAAINCDREMIFRVIAESDGGCSHVNQNVNKRLWCWYIDQLKLLANQEPRKKRFHLQINDVVHDFGVLDDALEYYFAILSQIPSHKRENLASGNLYYQGPYQHP